MQKADKVWYVSYGSNLNCRRLQQYLDAAGDNTSPARGEPLFINYPLYFAERSSKWNSAVAFIGTEKNSKLKTYAAAWLITWEQFEAVCAGENKIAVSDFSLDINEYGQVEWPARLGGWYSKILEVENTIDNPGQYPLCTLTSPVRRTRTGKDYLPGAKYLNTMFTGIKALHNNVTPAKFVNYVLSCGLSAFYKPAALAALIQVDQKEKN